MTDSAPQCPAFCETEIGNIVKGSWEEQDQIGWTHVAQGRLSKKWGEAHGKYYYANPNLPSRKDFSALNW